jgi:hypothetical protein
MKRRTLLTVGVVGGALLALAGGTLASLQPARKSGKLTARGRELFSAVSRTVLAGVMPATDGSRAMAAHLDRVESTLNGLPPALQAEVDEMLTILASPPGRLALAGLASSWADATPEALVRAIQSLRSSRLELRQQVYRALRDLTNASYFADAATWPLVGYPGPRAL